MILLTQTQPFKVHTYFFQVAQRGVAVAEFNIENTAVTTKFANNGYHFSGACGEILPAALAP